MATLPKPKPGERIVVSGRTGSGKSVLGKWLLERTHQHWVIFNPKNTKAYASLPDANVLNRFNASRVESSIAKHKYTILNFAGNENNPEFMDQVIQWLHDHYQNIGLVADELYTLHANGRPGPGLVSWLTRGRELRQSFIGLTQRPAWVSRFVFSEADYIVGMDLTLPEDRKRMRDNTGFQGFLNRLPPHHWRWYDVSADSDTLWGPVPIPSVQSE